MLSYSYPKSTGQNNSTSTGPLTGFCIYYALLLISKLLEFRLCFSTTFCPSNSVPLVALECFIISLLFVSCALERSESSSKSLISDTLAERRSSGVREKSHEFGAEWFSKLTFSWFNDIVTLGYRRPLEMEDLWDLHDDDKSAGSNLVYERIK